MKRYYAVFDTNVLVAALLTSNVSSPTVELLNHILDRTIIPVYNEEIINEYTEVLSRGKFGFSAQRIEAVINAIRSGIAADRTPAKWDFPDADDIVFTRSRSRSRMPTLSLATHVISHPSAKCHSG